MKKPDKVKQADAQSLFPLSLPCPGDNFDRYWCYRTAHVYLRGHRLFCPALAMMRKRRNHH